VTAVRIENDESLHRPRHSWRTGGRPATP
jgi:hypothetical protein